MPDENLDIDENLDGDGESSVIRQLREKANKTDTAEKEANDLRTEVALLRAGLDLTPARQKALLATHDGDLTADALKATAIELGFVPASDAAAEQAEQQVPDEEQGAHQRIHDATGNAPGADAEQLNVQAKLAELRASGDEVAAMAFLREQGMLVDGK